MSGQDLLEWLQEIPEADRRASECALEIFDKNEPLVTAKFYRAEGKIYLIHK